MVVEEGDDSCLGNSTWKPSASRAAASASSTTTGLSINGTARYTFSVARPTTTAAITTDGIGGVNNAATQSGSASHVTAGMSLLFVSALFALVA